MSQYKGTIFFKTTDGNSGWTERYYLQGDFAATALTALHNIVSARLTLLHASCAIILSTLSDVAISGDSLVASSTSQPGTATDAAGYLDVDLAMEIRWQCGVFNRNKTFCRGVPLSQTMNGKMVPTTPYLLLITDYIELVLANAKFYGKIANNPTPPPAFIPGYVVANDGNFVSQLARRKTGRPFGLRRGRRLAG